MRFFFFFNGGTTGRDQATFPHVCLLHHCRYQFQGRARSPSLFGPAWLCLSHRLQRQQQRCSPEIVLCQRRRKPSPRSSTSPQLGRSGSVGDEDALPITVQPLVPRVRHRPPPAREPRGRGALFGPRHANANSSAPKIPSPACGTGNPPISLPCLTKNDDLDTDVLAVISFHLSAFSIFSALLLRTLFMQHASTYFVSTRRDPRPSGNS